MEREIAQWVHPMKDRSDDPSHHERTLLPRSYISLPRDRKDRQGIHHKLEIIINPLDPVSHPGGIVHIVTGRVGPARVNVQDSIEVGREQMFEFERT